MQIYAIIIVIGQYQRIARYDPAQKYMRYESYNQLPSDVPPPDPYTSPIRYDTSHAYPNEYTPNKGAQRFEVPPTVYTSQLAPQNGDSWRDKWLESQAIIPGLFVVVRQN